MTFANAEQAEFWSGLAPTWVEIEDDLEEIAGEPGRLAMNRLDLTAGQTVVDLGCGTGRTTLELASRVDPNGQAVGVDIAAEMLERARQHAKEGGVNNAEFVHADVQANDLGAERFDSAFSRFGVMFYSDPLAAFANVRRSLRPGGTLSFVCWQPITANEWMLVPGMAAVSILGVAPQMPDPDAPGPFSLSDPERVRAILQSAEFKDVDVAAHADMVGTTEERIPYVASISMRVGAVRDLLKDADEATNRRVHEAIVEALMARVEDGTARTSRGVLLVKATA